MSQSSDLIARSSPSSSPAVKRGLYAFCADGDVTQVIQVIHLLRSFECQHPTPPPKTPAAAGGVVEEDVDDLRGPLVIAADGAHVHIVRYLLEFWFRDRIDTALGIDPGFRGREEREPGHTEAGSRRRPEPAELPPGEAGHLPR
ncbi:hypothetical protein DL767_009620 [Monosporascus sp. MG133]|nr:hypothetical protein DL767_009620 [Monosporascus sp. MG133]